MQLNDERRDFSDVEVDWSTVRLDSVLQAAGRYETGESISCYDQQLVNRWGDIDLFVSGRCMNATCQPRIVRALEDVLVRLPEETWETLAERDVCVVFPETAANWTGKVNVLAPPSEEWSEMSMWFIVLATYLNRCSHEKAVGTIAHELAHVVLEHASGSDDAEDEADTLACEWGFIEEIAASKADTKGL